MRGTLLSVGLIALTTTTHLVAQEPIDSVVSRLQPQQTVRVRTSNGQRLESRVRMTYSDPPALGLEVPDIPLSSTAIDSLWVRGRSTRTGAVVGALGLGAAGFISFGLVCGGFDGQPSDTCESESEYMLGAAAVGAVIGGLLGAAIGSGIPKWRLVYPRHTVALRPARNGLAAVVQLAF